MTIPEFLKRLRQCRDGWKLVGDGSIRREAPPVSRRATRLIVLQCPVTAVADLPVNRLQEASRKLGLSRAHLAEIIEAADNASLSPLRQNLLEATKLDTLL